MIKEMLKMDNVRIIYRNFTGEASKYNREGDRNFAVVIEDPVIAQNMADDGWNVKIRAPKEDGDDPFYYLVVKVKFNRETPRLNPIIYLRSGNNMRRLDEETIHLLDEVDIVNVDLDIRPYNYEINGKTGVTAYLDSICVTQKVDRFIERYGDIEY